MGLIYLDHLSATPLHPRVKEAMVRHLDTVFGNPVSDHQVGQAASQALDQARSQVPSLDVDRYGLVDPAAVEKAITPDTILISIMLANNEIGTMEPVADIAKIAKKHKIAFHTDAVDAVGIVPVDVKALGVNLLSLAAKHFDGPP